MAAAGSRFIPLDPEGRDEGDAEVAATFVPGADDVRGGHQGDAAAAATPPLFPLRRLRAGSPLGRAFWWAGLAVLGTAAAAVAVQRSFSAAAPGHDVPTGPTAVHGFVPDLLENEPVWASMPRGGTSTAVPRTPVSLPRSSISIQLEEAQLVNVPSDTLMSSGVVPNPVENQLVWANIPCRGTSTAVPVPGFVPNLLENEPVWANMPHGGTSTAVPRNPVSLPRSSISIQLEEAQLVNVPSDTLMSSGVVPNPVENQLVWANIPCRGTSTAVPVPGFHIIPEPLEGGPAPATVGPWSHSSVQGTAYVLNVLIVVLLLFAAAVVILQES